MSEFNPISCIKTLCALKKRQLEGAQKAALYIKNILQENAVLFSSELLATTVPRFISANLLIDGTPIPCLATGLKSGIIKSKKTIISSLTSSQSFLYEENINFNPLCATAISRSNHYFAPSIAVLRDDVNRILQATTVIGEIKVKPTEYINEQIFVGNQKNPDNILFCHYDSLGPGATDNASGVAVLLSLIIETPMLLNTCLFVFDGNEELSYDQPIYWGNGYRVFENRYGRLLENAGRIFVVDCVGDSTVSFINDPTICRLAFPIKQLERYLKKITLVSGDYDTLMQVYHSEADLPGRIDQVQLQHAVAELKQQLK